MAVPSTRSHTNVVAPLKVSEPPKVQDNITVHLSSPSPSPSPKAESNVTSKVILDEQSPKLDVHSKIRLFPHQQALTAKMIEMETTPRKGTFVGVLTDPPGSGKSYSLLALILYEKKQFGKTQNLLVIPHNIHKQWIEYIKNFSDELQVKSLMYHGDITALFYDARVLSQYDILITTSTFYDMVTSTTRDIGVCFNRVIMDEIDSISFFTMTKIASQSVWLVSATADLTTSGAYLEYTKRNGIRCDPSFIKRSINLPPPSVTYHSCFNEYVDIMKNVLNSQEMKSVYAIDFTMFKFNYLRNEDAISTPKKLLSAKFRDDCLHLHSTIDALKLLELGAEYQTYLPQVVARQIEQKEKLQASVNKIIENVGKTYCAMCCDRFLSPVMTVVDGQEHNVDRPIGKTKCCRHSFCFSCLHKWIEKTPRCPTCSNKLTGNDIDIESPSNDVNKDSKDIKDIKDKMDNFEEILLAEVSKDNSRILVFSDLSGTFTHVQDILKKHNLPFAEIEGNQYTMDRAMADYKSGKRPILLVDSQSHGAGMNMEMTTAVIIMHETDREAQIVGRAQRLGRTDKLRVHHLIYPSER